MVAKVGTYFARATRLCCPACGVTPIFPPVRTIRRLWDWFHPFDGCPRCGYAFEREPGYFLMAVWAINCGTASLLGLVIYLFLEMRFTLPMHVLLPAVFVPVALCNVLFARHSKAYFIALDHLLDPHERGGGDDRGNQPLDPDIDPTEPCETETPVR
jgi:uncharacterized protein (DUF983 family)